MTSATSIGRTSGANHPSAPPLMGAKQVTWGSGENEATEHGNPDEYSQGGKGVVVKKQHRHTDSNSPIDSQGKNPPQIRGRGAGPVHR